MKKFPLIFFIGVGLFIFFQASLVFAQNKQPDINEALGFFGEKWTPHMLGLSCGVPGKKGNNQCCNLKKAKKTLEEEPGNLANTVPEFFCLPPGLSRAADVGGGFLGDILDTVLAPIRVPIEAGVKLVSGDFGGILDTLKSFFLPDKTINAIARTVKGDKVCLSDASKLIIGSVVGIIPTYRVANLDIPAQECIEGAAPRKTGNKCVCVRDTSGFANVCNQYVRTPQENRDCMRCVGKHGVWTGLGCIGSDLPTFTASIVGIGTGLAGGIAFLCILYSAILFQMSRGNPETLKKAREYMTNCIIGLLLILFAVFILRVIGVDILGIPGFK